MIGCTTKQWRDSLHFLTSGMTKVKIPMSKHFVNRHFRGYYAPHDLTLDKDYDAIDLAYFCERIHIGMEADKRRALNLSDPLRKQRQRDAYFAKVEAQRLAAIAAAEAAAAADAEDLAFVQSMEGMFE
jgi:hypothetical protein